MPTGFTTSDGIDFNEVYYDSIVPSLQRYNEDEQNDFRAILCADDDERIKNTILNTTDVMQKLASNQTPDMIKMARGRYQGLTEFYGTGYAYTFEFMKDAKASDVEDLQAKMFKVDRNTIKSTIMKAVMNDPGNTLGATQGALWNQYFETYEGITTPPNYKSNTFASSHTHYAFSGATTIALDDFTAAEAHIREHGGEGTLVAFINSAQRKQVQDLAGWTTSGTISNPITDIISTTGNFTQLLGWTIVIDDTIPAGFIFFAMYDDLNLGKLARFHEPNNPSFRGLQIIPGPNPNYPLIGAYYFRFMGVKVFNRGNAVAMKLHGSAYSNPF